MERVDSLSAHLQPLLATLALRGRPLAEEGRQGLLRPERARLGLTVERTRRQRTRRDRCVVEPGCLMVQGGGVGAF